MTSPTTSAGTRYGPKPPGYESLGNALSEYAGGELTPARDRAVRTTIAASASFFGGSINPSDADLDLASIVVPVFDPTSEDSLNSGLVLRLGHLPQGMTGQQALEFVEAMQAAAAEVAKTLATTAAKDYNRYANAGLR
ncbi:hypothetical protein [Yaniella halotolerans]|uniref:hypothetical protein n=1 Tax=Yaniella halotolerans TaxID=225453 RepID=UPI00040A7E93|nr:hypothetical protein [Yaniella halotolerans]